MARLEIYVALLRKWQKALNLIGRGTEKEIWHRHITDSAQLLRHAPPDGRWLDLGSGAGLPGLVVAICSDREVTLVESDSRKCTFLREAARATGARAEIRNSRIEDLHGAPGMGDFAVVSARALAPLPELLALSAPFFGRTTVGLFQKGARWQDELTAAAESWIFDATPSGSLTHPDSVVLRLTQPMPRSQAGPGGTMSPAGNVSPAAESGRGA
ncbi:16S rRNA (guanine(527)-N(7))-methyltransferase RsmG [Marinibaculum pumilum]|uniref:Ribosomal RNA small subunit methyltransferase G n=1 Tax=Marinibaculum pumilum TaxID=1766165 RepID=A0ABV7KV39_9PROT